MDRPPGQNQDPATFAARCVLVTPRRAAADDRLLMLLESRGWRTHTVHDPYLALAELCLLEHGDIAATHSGWDRGNGVRLVIQQPDDDLQQALMSAAKRYVPSASIWSYDGEGLNRVAAATSTAMPASSEPPLPMPHSAVAPAALRYADSGDPPPAPPPANTPEDNTNGAEEDSAAITPEEIALLFAPGPRDGSTP